MNFTAPAFVLALPLVAALHWALPPRARWVLLLAASLGFYTLGSPQALPLLAGITLGTYLAAIMIQKCSRPAARRFWLWCAVALCLGCLGVFKYAGLFGAGTSLLLPAGISFYTFQTLGYVIDVYRGRLQPEQHLGYYALFVSFFPQLVAGPIERSTDLLPQLRDPARRPDLGGLLYILRGFVKKLLLADTAAVFVDAVYANPAQATGPAALLATVLFAWQIYWDFSGYSDIAVGAAALVGVKLSRNFDHPYRADSLRDFWHRWHVSLTRWFTDYVYIPLGGSRCGAVRWAVNTMVVFLLSGLWHGAALHFVVWGAVHGGMMVAERVLSSWPPLRGGSRRSGWGREPRLDPKPDSAARLSPSGPSGHLPRRGRQARRALTFALVCFAWVFFRATSVSDAFTLFSRLPVGWNFAEIRLTALTLGAQPTLQLVLGALCLHLLPETPPETPTPRGALAFCLLALAAFAAWFAALYSGTANAFIYFQF